MNKIYRTIKVYVCKWLVKEIKKSYGADCQDVDQFVLEQGGCMSCKAKIVVEFLEEYIEIIKT